MSLGPLLCGRLAAWTSLEEEDGRHAELQSRVQVFLEKSTCPQSHVYVKLLNSIVSDAITETKVRCRRQSPEPKDSGD